MCPEPTAATAIAEGNPAPAAAAATASAASAPTASPSVDPGATPDPTAPPAYTPNFKFKVADFEPGKTQKEMEIDKLFHGIIKDAESEKAVRELHEKAFGLDAIKQDRAKIQDSFKEMRGKFDEQTGFIHEMQRLRDSNDLDGFFELAGIHEQKLFEHVAKKLQYQQLPADQRAEIDANNRFRRDSYNQERQQNQQAAMLQQVVQQQHDQMIDFSLASPQVQPIVSAFDARVGSGAFKRLVRERGFMAFQTTGKDIPIDQAIQEAIAMIGPQGNVASQSQQAGTPPAQKPPTIPNVGAGTGSSPTRKQFTSIADIEKHRDDFMKGKR